MKQLFLVIFFFFFSIGLSAQEIYLDDVEATQELSTQVVELFKRNEIKASFALLNPYWPMPQNELEAIEIKTIKYLNLIKERFGAPIGSLKVKNETISDIATRETYLIRYENTAIRLIFTYYKNDKGWIVNAFKWDDSFGEEFK